MSGRPALEGVVTAVVDCSQRSATVVVFERLCRAMAIRPVGPPHWEPYAKLGPHSLIESSFALSARNAQSAIAELDRLAGIVAAVPDGYDPDLDHSRTVIRYRNGMMDYSRTMDVRIMPFTVDGVVWMELRARIR